MANYNAVCGVRNKCELDLSLGKKREEKEVAVKIDEKEKQKKNWAWERMQKMISETQGRRPSLLLHACCAPCSSSVLEQLASHFKLAIHYYNPNIYPKAEYLRRLDELKKFLPRFMNDVKLVEAPYNPSEFYEAVEIKSHPERRTEGERKERCRACYSLRMKRAYEYAAMNGYEFFTTTLSVSPHKDSNAVNEIGLALEEEAAQNLAFSFRPRFLIADFKKKNGYKRSLELSTEYNLYRQDYCGCVYSKHERKLQAKKLAENEVLPILDSKALLPAYEGSLDFYIASCRVSS